MVSVTRRGTVSMDEMLRIQAVFAGSAVSSLSIRVNDYAALLDPVRDQYYGGGGCAGCEGGGVIQESIMVNILESLHLLIMRGIKCRNSTCTNFK